MTWTGRILGLLLALVVLPGAAQGQPGGSSVKLSEITLDSSKVTTVQIKTSGAAKYHAQLIDTPTRLVIDLDDTLLATKKMPATTGADPIRQIRASQYRKNVTRIVIEFAHKVAYKIAATGSGLDVVVNAPAVAAAKAAPTGSKPVAAAPKPGESAAAARPAAPTPAVRKPVAPAPTAVAVKPAPPAPVEVAEARPPAPVPAPPPPPAPAANGSRLISFDFKDADVVNLLRILAAESGRNIVIGDDVKGKMSITLRNVPWQTALDTILEARGLQKIEKDNLIRIVSNEQLTREREAAARLEETKLKAEADIRQKMADVRKAEDAVAAGEAARKEAEARGPLREETIRLAYADPVEITKTLQGILGIPPQGLQASPLTPPAGAPPIAEPPFSALYGTAPAPAPKPAAPSPSAEVLSRGITIQPNPATNSIFIRHYERDLERIKKLIHETLDIPLPQVKIEARLEEIDRSALEAIGVTWGGGIAGKGGDTVLVGQGTTSPISSGGAIAAPAGIGVLGQKGRGNTGLTLTPPTGQILPVSPTTGLPTGGSLINLPLSAFGFGDPTAGIGFGIIGTRFNINLALQALATESKTRTLARPEIVTVENNQAIISLGEQIPYATVSSAGTQIQFVNANLQLQVTPTVILEKDATKIKMKVVVDNNSRGATVNLGGSGTPPAINTQHAETQVLIKEGERLVIGGVGTSTDIINTRKVPLLGDIPLLGWLFKTRGTNTTSKELVVFLTPSVLKQPGPAGPPTPTK